MLIATVTIERRLSQDGDDIVSFKAVRPDGEPLPVIETLGMLALAEDSVLHSPEDEG